MRILLVGKGGRENAFAWKIAQSSRLTRLYAAPGNPGIARYAECVDIDEMDFEGLVSFATGQSIDLVVVGPEAPLDAGLVDRLQDAGIRAFGPTKAAAQIEADKDFALGLMHRHGIPTGEYRTFTQPEPARGFIQDWGAPVVIKASGLAAGKGAIVCETVDDALATVDEILVDRSFGEAGDKLVVMEYLEGEEASIFGFTDGKSLMYAASAQDHKRIGEGDTGLNTGGMGAYAPAPVVTPELEQEVYDRVMQPTIDALAQEGRPYVGILYGGLIFTAQGPKVIEFNCRLGDPEAQVVLPLLQNDIVDIFDAALNETIDRIKVEPTSGAACCVVVASDGYPTSYDTGHPISGMEDAEDLGDVIVFHAGTAEQDGAPITAGGRVLAVTGVDANTEAAIDRTYRAVNLISFENRYFRRDIGHRALSRLAT